MVSSARDFAGLCAHENFYFACGESCPKKGEVSLVERVVVCPSTSSIDTLRMLSREGDRNSVHTHDDG